MRGSMATETRTAQTLSECEEGGPATLLLQIVMLAKSPALTCSAFFAQSRQHSADGLRATVLNSERQ